MENPAPHGSWRILLHMVYEEPCSRWFMENSAPHGLWRTLLHKVHVIIVKQSGGKW